MALEQGNVSLRRFFPAENLPGSRQDVWFDKLNEHRLMEVDNLQPESENGGWAVLGNELSTDFNEKNVLTGSYVSFAYRRDTVKLPSGLVDLHLKAMVAVEEEIGERVDRIQKVRMKEDIVQDLLATTHPNIETAGVLVDTSTQVVYFASTSDKLTDEFLLLFYKGWGIQLVEADYETCAHRLLENDDAYERLIARPALNLVPDLDLHPDFEDPADVRLGSCFLTWFYHFLQSGESVWASEAIEEINVDVDDVLTLAGETFGSREIVIKKGNVANCRELAAALAAGKSISKVRFQLYRGDDEDARLWTFGLEKRSISLQSLKLPKSEEPDNYGQRLDRFDAIAEVHDILDDIYRDFVQLRTSDAWLETLEDMKHWVAEMDGSDAIWEINEARSKKKMPPVEEAQDLHHEPSSEEEPMDTGVDLTVDDDQSDPLLETNSLTDPSKLDPEESFEDIGFSLDEEEEEELTEV